ncbi:capsular polysaccharide synthesis protein [Parvularcula marina]|nr:capsular polysaccharide synthesis protein [Parvularcula marina]
MMNRVIWMLWLQGEDNAPPVPKACIKSWRHYNPSWDVRVLDRNNMGDFIDLPGTFGIDLDTLPPAAISDMARLALLHRHGGVWADATCLCARPLDTWLPTVLDTEKTFALDRPAPDRLLATYFIAATKGAPLIAAWHEEVSRLWKTWPAREVSTADQTFKWLKYHSSAQPIVLGNEHFAGPNRLPYFWAHYLFARLVQKSPEFAQRFARVPKVSAKPSLIFSTQGFRRELHPYTRAAFQWGLSPLYKLDWREAELGPGPTFAINEKNWPAPGTGFSP